MTSDTIVFPSGARARTVRAVRTAPAGELARALELPPVRGLIVLNGGTVELDHASEERLRVLLADGLARVATEEGLTVITGGTDAGVFSLFGLGLGDRSPIACVGVAPAARVTWPGRADAAADAVPLEPHHSHFVLVEGDQWGDETGTMMRLADAIAAGGPSVAVLAGGGDVAKGELLAHVRAGREVVVLSGSGRLADEVSDAVATAGMSRDPELREVAASGRVILFDVSGRPDELRTLVRARLARRRHRRRYAPALLRHFPAPGRRPPPDSPFVPAALRADLPLLDDELAYLDETVVPRFRALDHAALRAQHSFRLASVVLILGSATATSLGAAQTAAGGGSLALGIAEGVVAAAVSAILVYARGRRFQQTYLGKRVAAERMKSQYYLFLARAGSYAVDNDARRDRLERALDGIEAGEEPA